MRHSSGLSHCLCCNNRAVRICVACCFNCTEGDPSLVAVTLHSHITVSPATCHPVQCRANMRVADCATVWVCKCLQLIYLSALHLTLFDIYSAIYIYKKLFQFSIKRVCLGAMTIHQGLEFLWTFWFAREHDKIWDLRPFEDKQASLVQSMRAKGKIAEKQLKLEFGKASRFGFTGWGCTPHFVVWNGEQPQNGCAHPLCKIRRTALTLGCSNFMRWQPSECPEGLARSNWNAAFISLRELQILWLAWSQIAESTDTSLWQSAPATIVAYPIASVATTELSESVLLAVSIAPKGILLLLQWHCIRILQSHRRPVIQCNVGQTWGLLTVPLSEFANVCSWFIWVHST